MSTRLSIFQRLVGMPLIGSLLSMAPIRSRIAVLGIAAAATFALLATSSAFSGLKNLEERLGTLGWTLAPETSTEARIVIVAIDEPSIDELRELLKNQRTVAVGHSGVGKSTLVNALVPDADRATGIVNEVTGRGRHTSSSVRAIRLPEDFGDAWVIDTPGVRSFGLGHVKPENILKSFEDLYAVIETCPRDCSHLSDAPDCALDQHSADAAATDAADLKFARRVDSLRRLMSSLSTAGKSDD